jgi:serine/threonine-protein kinase
VRQGTVIRDRFRVDRTLGEGSFAVVYAGYDLVEHRPVALKILQRVERESHVEVRRRFIREAELVGQINHPDVVAVHDLGTTEDGALFLVLELVAGIPLSTVLKHQGAMEPGRAIRMMSRCLGAVAAAHDMGVIHRDFKPENLILDARSGVERLRILDFGIGFIADTVGGRLTQEGLLNGTPAYIAPEYAMNQIITPALDVYQLGLILVEMLTGEPVVKSKNPFECLMAHANGTLDLPLDFMLSSVGPIITKALALDHTQRYANAREFRDALDKTYAWTRSEPAIPAKTGHGGETLELNVGSGSAFEELLKADGDD